MDLWLSDTLSNAVTKSRTNAHISSIKISSGWSMINRRLQKCSREVDQLHMLRSALPGWGVV